MIQRALPPAANHPEVAKALQDCRRAFWGVAILSGAVNLLMFAGPLYMLQIYDRVLASRSVPTLVALSICLVGAYAFQGVFDLIRGRIVARAAAALDQRLATSVHGAVLRLGVFSRHPGDALQPLRDLDQIRAFLSGGGPIAIVDLPWMPVFLVVCFLISPLLGVLSLAGAAALVLLTYLTERASRDPTRALVRDGGLRMSLIESGRRNSETVMAMGMGGDLAQRWSQVNGRYLGTVRRSTDVVAVYGAITRVLRLLLQSMILGAGAWLVIQQSMTAGSMMAASIMMSRALAPIETAIANWRAFVAAREGVRRLSELLTRMPPRETATPLPRPARSLDVERVIVIPPTIGPAFGADAILRDIRFNLTAGEALGIIGPSGCGKTSLARVLVGVWAPADGTVRLDGAALDQWDQAALGRHIGFMSQNVELFDGTVAENIARMAGTPNAEAVQAAAQVAGAHDMILHLPRGYDTPIGDGGAILSGGQRQRVALARALYGDPFLLVLDEPNANLDSDGEAALLRALQTAKARGAIVILIAHRAAALAICDKVLYLAKGTQQAFGPRDEVLQSMMARPAPATMYPNVSLKVVADATTTNSGP